MGLFGNLFKSRKQRQGEQAEGEQIERLKRNPITDPIVGLIEAFTGGADKGEMEAALSRTMICDRCRRPFVVRQGWKESSLGDGWWELTCPFDGAPFVWLNARGKGEVIVDGRLL